MSAYIQGWGTYHFHTLVVVGESYDRVLARFKAKGIRKGVAESFVKHVRPSEFEGGAFVWVSPETNVTLLFFKEWEHDFDHIDTLVHETHHLVHFLLGQNCGLEREAEALAYQQEYLFRSIRRRLSPPKKRKRKS